MTARRRTRVPLDPAAALEAAKAAAYRKAELTPHLLSEKEAMLLPGRKLLEIGNAGHLQHLGIGVPAKTSAAPKARASSPERPMLTDAQLARMTGEQVRRAAAEGRVPGIGARRRTWGR